MRRPAVPTVELPFATDPSAYEPERFADFCDQQFNTQNDSFYDPVTGHHVLFRHADVERQIKDRDSRATLDPLTSRLAIAAHIVTIPLIGQLITGAKPVTANQDKYIHKEVKDAMQSDPYGLSPATSIMHRRYGDLVSSEVAMHARRIYDNQKDGLDLVTQFADPLAMGVIARLQGMPHDEGAMKNMKEMVNGQTSLLGQKLKGRQLVYALRSLVRLLELNNRTAEQGRNNLHHNGNRPYDFTTQMVDMVGVDNTRSAGMNVGAAGVSTTAGLIGNAARAMLSDSDRTIWNALTDSSNPGLQHAALSELERCETPLVGWKGRLNKKTTLSKGTTLRKGTPVLYALGMANRDPEVFDNPHTMQLGRSGQHLTYGRGPHTCVGRSLAQLEVLTAFTTLRSFEQPKEAHLELIRPEGGYQYAPDSLFRTLRSLPVVWRPYS